MCAHLLAYGGAGPERETTPSLPCRAAAARSRCMRRRSGRDDFGSRKGTFTISRRTHPCRLDVFGKTEAAGQRGVGEEGDLVNLVAAQGEDHHAPGLRAQVVAEGRLAVGARRA